MPEKKVIRIEEKEKSFLKEKFRDYYRRGVTGPRKIESREFGVGNFGKKIEYRHMTFRNQRELNGYLVNDIPMYISYSTSYYEFPAKRPMSMKGWIAGDLVFDLDCGDIERKCSHDPDWVCTDCLSAVKDETIKLVEDFLIPDFGLDRKEMKIYFSGQKGYHVHVFNEDYQKLGKRARKEISSYILAENVHAGFRIVKGVLEGPSVKDKGLSGKVCRKLIEALNKEHISIRTGKNISKDQFISGIENGIWRTGRKTAEKAFEHAKKMTASMIDSAVTYDTSKLIRMPESLHGSSGLKVAEVRKLSDFDPFRDAVVFGEETVAVTAESPEFMLKDQTFGPFKGEKAELPAFAAVYLLAKKRGKLIG